MKCCVITCKNYSDKRSDDMNGIGFQILPSKAELKEEWIRRINRPNWTPTKYTRICSCHFKKKDFKITKKGFKRLKEGALPCYNLSGLNQYEDEDLDAENTPGASSQYGNQGSSPSRHEIKIFCPKCNSEVSHTAQGIQEDQTKLIIARVYHYLEQEFQELKNIYENLDLTPLSRIHQRAAFATGVNETTVFEILKEEENRNAVKQMELLESQRQAQRSGQDDSSQENCSDDEMADAGEQSGIQEESEIETLVVKVEPPEYYEEPEIILQQVNVKSEPQEQEKEEEADPISVDVKTEHQDEKADNANETLGFNEPDSSKRRGKKRQRKNEVTTQQQSQGGTSTTEPSTSVTYTEELDESSLLGEREVKIEKLEIHEEGFS